MEAKNLTFNMEEITMAIRSKENNGELWFSVIDAIKESLGYDDIEKAKNYWKYLKKRLISEGVQLGSLTTQLKLVSSDGKAYMTDVATLKNMLRIIQSIHSPKVEAVKQWLAKVGSERIKEDVNPQLAINRIHNKLAKKHGEKWATKRLQGMVRRKEITDYWHNNGIKEGKEYAQLTDTMYKEWSGMNTREYKEFKDISQKANLRDNMSATELLLTELAETLSLEEAKLANAYGFDENNDACHRGGEAVYDARLAIEEKLNRSVLQGKAIK